jgi:hypothetical protein
MTGRRGMRRRGEGAQPARRLAGLGRLDAEAIAFCGGPWAPAGSKLGCLERNFSIVLEGLVVDRLLTACGLAGAGRG